MRRFKSILLAASVVSVNSCIHLSHNKSIQSHTEPKMVSLSNEGMLCAYKPTKDEIVVTYYPLSSNCISSSVISWKLLGFDTKVDGEKLKIDSYALYKRVNTKVATADCGGAGVVKKHIRVPSAKTTLFWGDKELITMPYNKNIVCFKKRGNNISSAKPFRD